MRLRCVRAGDSGEEGIPGVYSGERLPLAGPSFWSGVERLDDPTGSLVRLVGARTKSGAPRTLEPSDFAMIGRTHLPLVFLLWSCVGLGSLSGSALAQTGVAARGEPSFRPCSSRPPTWHRGNSSIRSVRTGGRTPAATSGNTTTRTTLRRRASGFSARRSTRVYPGPARQRSRLRESCVMPSSLRPELLRAASSCPTTGGASCTWGSRHEDFGAMPKVSMHRGRR